MSSNYITKSKYVDFCKCPQLYYLNQFHPELASPKSEFMKHLSDNGNKVGELARLYFDNSITISKKSNQEMYKDTLSAIKFGKKIICEASFIYEDLFCAVDLLKINDDNSYEIYEVKSVSKVEEYHKWDASFQYYVLTKLGYNVTKTTLLILNDKYVFNNKLNVKDYFKEYNFDLYDNIERNIDEIRKINNKLPLLACKYCQKSANEFCPFFDYCFKNLPDHNIFQLGGLLKKYNYFNRGIKTYKDFYDDYDNIIKIRKLEKKKDSVKINNAYEQVSHYLNKEDIKFERDNVKDFIDTLVYPLYYLDFETYKDIIPFINGTKTNYERIVQYSLHIQQNGFDNLVHKEYLQESKYDNLEEVAINLIKDLGEKGSIIVYHKSEEDNRIKSLAELLPKYRKQLESISDRIIDLEIPFVNRYIYTDEMYGRSSIKLVLPAMVPEFKDAYVNLPSVHNGTQAIRGYEQLIDKQYKEHDKLKHDMLAYCEMDTLAMVKVLEKIYKEINNR